MNSYRIQHFNRADSHVEVTAAFNKLVSTINDMELRIDQLEIRNDELQRIVVANDARFEGMENAVLYLKELTGKG